MRDDQPDVSLFAGYHLECGHLTKRRITPDMSNPDIEQLVERIMQSLPEGLQTLRQEADQQLRAALRRALQQMDLVTREEFDIQREVLLRTRARLEELEQQVQQLEQQLSQTPHTD